ncbi:hypothetical protein TanjilG_08879 [Lupinus angustifolius]|uniref:U5 small nuclear ribonucleoprotein TSSC4 n=1 Tax=Lupinus angustifolius TaxID=3871 RepID=A0A394DIV3_LUPAN|nr:PREDICTED: uncharacterized protein LOC109338149 [Lupinus angustifolius]OIW20337.1 hypothetical protein TanjilG_08879 [Lupinus angustifolius]
MEDSFKARLDKAFGSLPIPSSSLNSLWSLTNDQINHPKPNPEPEPKPDPEPEPFSDPRSRSSSSSGLRVELEKDIEDLDDVDDDDDKAPRGGESKPDDYDEEQWEIKSGIGLDCTLDYEDEEDHFDKQAIGKENSGSRLYMKDINDDDIGITSRNVLLTTYTDFGRDPRANHLAARIRLKQDDEAASKKIDSLHVSEKSEPGIGSGDAVNPKSILKRKDNPSEPKSRKRVRFDSECDDRGNDDEPERTRDVPEPKSSSMEEDLASNQTSKSQAFASAVPDYIRNPSRYTHYTFDSSGDMDDKSNKEACMSFLSQLRESKAAAGTGSQADDALDDLPSVTFISKKKSGDATMGESEMLLKQKLDVGKELTHRGPFTLGIAVGDTENSDVCAMEEDEAEVVEDTKKSSQKSNRQYRKKTQDELEEPVV